MRDDRCETNHERCDLPHKRGTTVQDLVHPSRPSVIKATLGRKPGRSRSRLKQRLADGRAKGPERKVIALTADLVCLNSTRATLPSSDVNTFRAYFLGEQELPLVCILATAVEETVLTYSEKQGFLVRAVGDEPMKVKNGPCSTPTRRSRVVAHVCRLPGPKL